MRVVMGDGCLLGKLSETNKQEVHIFVQPAGPVSGCRCIEMPAVLRVVRPGAAGTRGGWHLWPASCLYLACRANIIFLCVVYCDKDWEALFCAAVLSLGSTERWRIALRHTPSGHLNESYRQIGILEVTPTQPPPSPCKFLTNAHQGDSPSSDGALTSSWALDFRKSFLLLSQKRLPSIFHTLTWLCPVDHM